MLETRRREMTPKRLLAELTEQTNAQSYTAAELSDFVALAKKQDDGYIAWHGKMFLELDWDRLESTAQYIRDLEESKEQLSILYNATIKDLEARIERLTAPLSENEVKSIIFDVENVPMSICEAIEAFLDRRSEEQV